jgi:hypothetical protein
VLGDLISITDVQRYLFQKVLNVYYYRVTSITGLSGAYLSSLADVYEDLVIDAVRQEQCNSLEHRLIECRNLTNGVDAFDKTISVFGSVSDSGSEASPSFTTLSWKLVRESLTTRNGYKRFAAPPEGRIFGNSYTFDTGNEAEIAAALSGDLVISAITVAEPVIVKRPIPAAPISSYEYSSIGAAQFMGVGTQLTRKLGRGD